MLCKSSFHKLYKHPLCPLVILRINSLHLTRPVKHRPHRAKLLAHVFNIFFSPLARVYSALYRCVLCRQTESVKTYRIKHVVSQHFFVSGINVCNSKSIPVPHMQIAGRIRKLNQNIVIIFTIHLIRCLVYFVFFPIFLPLFFYFFVIVLLHVLD